MVHQHGPDVVIARQDVELRPGIEVHGRFDAQLIVVGEGTSLDFGVRQNVNGCAAH